MIFTLFMNIFVLVFSAINLISINAQGLRTDERRQTAFNFFRRNKYDIIFLQETHWTQEKHFSIQQEWKGPILLNDGIDSACSVAILFSEKLDLKPEHVKCDSHGRTLATVITIENLELNLVNIYAPRTDTERRKFYMDLENLLRPENNILAGDLNSIDNARMDKHGGNPHARNSANKILSAVSSRNNLFDVWRNSRKTLREYTWAGRNTRDNSIIRTRIDKFLINRSLSPFVSKTSIKPYPNSDHDLITLNIDFTQQERGKGFWHFNNSLLADPIFAEEITAFWTNWLKEKSKFKNPLKWWDKAKSHFKGIAIQRSTILCKIEQN